MDAKAGILDERMRALLEKETQWVIWPLCALIALMSALSPICGACDDIGTFHSSPAHSIDKIPPASPVDQCNGVCSCCGFHWLPVVEPLEIQIEFLHVLPSIAKQRLVSRQLAPRFQPPRA
jgi:hypothetical protein